MLTLFFFHTTLFAVFSVNCMDPSKIKDANHAFDGARLLLNKRKTAAIEESVNIANKKCASEDFVNRWQTYNENEPDEYIDETFSGSNLDKMIDLAIRTKLKNSKELEEIKQQEWNAVIFECRYIGCHQTFDKTAARATHEQKKHQSQS